MESFSEIINNQICNKNFLFKEIKQIEGGFTICIKNNSIHNIIDGYGFVHPKRKKQYIQLLKNVLDKYNLKDINININLSDHPKEGVFNFCRIKNNNKCFLLPDFRFTLEDTKLDDNIDNKDLNNFDDTVKYLQSLHSKYNYKNKKSKFYMDGLEGAGKRIPYYIYALNNKDKCDGNLYGGSVHGYGRTPINLIPILEKNNLASKIYKNFCEHFNYKYIMYYDGNTLSNRTKLLLNVNSVIIMKNTPYEEFYSYKLKNNINYILFNHESELTNIFNYLESNEKLCNNIIQNNKNFINNILTYNNILEYTFCLLNNLL